MAKPAPYFPLTALPTIQEFAGDLDWDNLGIVGSITQKADIGLTGTYAAAGAITVNNVGAFAAWPAYGVFENLTTLEQLSYTRVNSDALIVNAQGRARNGTAAAGGGIGQLIRFIDRRALGRWQNQAIVELVAHDAALRNLHPQNDIINGACEFFHRGGISAPVAMGDATYTGPDRFYSLIQSTNATEQQVAAPAGFRSRYVLQLVSGGTTNRFGKATVLEGYQSVPMRGLTKTFSLNVRASKNAGSGNINIRAAILEWTGAADSVTKDVVNNWASGSYTAGNFFNSTTLNVIAVSPQIAVAHGVAQQVSLTGTFGNSLNNAILMVWVQDVPAHASDLIQLSEFGLYQGNYAPALWLPRFASLELALCNRFCYPLIEPAGTHYVCEGLGVRDGSQSAYHFFALPQRLRNYATATYAGNISGFSSGVAPTTTLMGIFNWPANAYVTLAGTYGWGISYIAPRVAFFNNFATGSFSGSAGQAISMVAGPDVRFWVENEL